MADDDLAREELRLSEVQLRVKSRILERLAEELAGDERMSSTMYTKSDGKNYGMYQKSDAALSDIYDRLFGAGGVNRAAFKPHVNLPEPQ